MRIEGSTFQKQQINILGSYDRYTYTVQATLRDRYMYNVNVLRVEYLCVCECVCVLSQCNKLLPGDFFLILSSHSYVIRFLPI